MPLSHLPPLLNSTFFCLASWLHKRSARRLPQLLLGVLFATGRRTVTSWFRAAAITDDFRPAYTTVCAVGRQVPHMAVSTFFAVKPLLSGPRLTYFSTQPTAMVVPPGRTPRRRSYASESQASVGDTRSAISRPPQRRAHAAWRANPRGEAVRGALHRVPGGFRALDRSPFRIVRRPFRRDSLLRERYPEGFLLLLSAFPAAISMERRTTSRPCGHASRPCYRAPARRR
jgi:hypothetical protein